MRSLNDDPRDTTRSTEAIARGRGGVHRIPIRGGIPSAHLRQALPRRGDRTATGELSFVQLRAQGHDADRQFELSGELRWKGHLRNSTVSSAPRESCFLARPAFVAAEAEIVSTHAGERIKFSRARVRART